MIDHTKISDSVLNGKIRRREIGLAGNVKLKIYGTLSCASGKRMKRKNRVFFTDKSEAIRNNFRPCGHCMRTEYQNWKNGTV